MSQVSDSDFARLSRNHRINGSISSLKAPLRCVGCWAVKAQGSPR